MRERNYSELLSQIYGVMDRLFDSGPEPKAQLCEILVLLNRTASESVEMEPSYPVYAKLMQMDQPESIKLYAVHYIQNLIDRIISKETKTGDDWVNQAKGMIRTHFNEPLTMEDVAHNFGFSTYYFSRLFKQSFGMSFVDYLTGIRLEKAKTMLKQNGISVKDVCFAVGYSEPNYFTRVFKKETGMTPTEYQKNANGAN